MQTNDVWYKATGYCSPEEYELATYFLMEAGVGALEELETSTPERTRRLQNLTILFTCRTIYDRYFYMPLGLTLTTIQLFFQKMEIKLKNDTKYLQ